MAIAIASLLNVYDPTDGSSFSAFGNFTPGAGQTIFVRVTNYGATTSCSLSDSAGHVWTPQTTTTVGSRRQSIFSAPDNGVYSASTPTAAFGGVGQTGCHITVIGVTGLVATNDGVKQAVSGNGTSTTAAASLAAFASANNATLFFGSMAQNAAASSNNLTNPAGFPVESGGAGPNQDSITCAQLSPNTGPQAVWGASASWMAAALELEAAGGLAVPVLMHHYKQLANAHG